MALKQILLVTEKNSLFKHKQDLTICKRWCILLSLKDWNLKKWQN